MNVDQMIMAILKRQTSLTAFCATLLLFQLQANAADPDTTVAKLGGVELKTSQLDALLDPLDAEAKIKLKKNPDVLKRIVQTEMIRLSVLKEATDKQWDKRADVQKQLQRTREQAIVSSYLNDVTRPPANFPSDQEMREFYTANKNAFPESARYHIAQIFIASDKKNGGDAGSKKAKEIADKAQNADFSKLANQYSEHKDSATKGGDMGWLEESQLIPELQAQLSKLAIGQVSYPISSASGWHIVKLLESKPAGIKPYENVRDAIKSNMRFRKAQLIEQQYLEKMLASQQLSINQTTLDEAVR